MDKIINMILIYEPVDKLILTADCLIAVCAKRVLNN